MPFGDPRRLITEAFGELHTLYDLGRGGAARECNADFSGIHHEGQRSQFEFRIAPLHALCNGNIEPINGKTQAKRASTVTVLIPHPACWHRGFSSGQSQFILCLDGQLGF